jgi:uncharacterized cupin superfamily protein
MTSGGPLPISLERAVAALTFLPDRRPTTTPDEARDAFVELSGYRDGGIFVGHWAGESEWERHTVGEEVVMVIEGETTIFFRTDEGEQSAPLGAGDLVVVPQGTWHRFETPDGVKLLSVTPQPTDHSPERPD